MGERPASGPSENELAAFLRERVRRDEERAPDFARLKGGPRRRSRRPRRLARVLAAAAALACALVTGLVLVSRREARRPAARSVSLATWRPPTESLAPLPGELWTSTPSILEPPPDYSALERSLEKKGDRS